MIDLSKVSPALAIAERQVVLLCVGWALLSLVGLVAFALLPSAVRAGGWIAIASLLKIGAFVIATVVCWRNARENAIVSGQVVWQAIAVGLGFFALGDIVSLLWNLLWSASTSASLARVFHGISHLFLSIGLFNAVLPRQTSLSLPQAIGIAIIGISGILLASWVSFYTPNYADARLEARSDQTPMMLQAAATQETALQANPTELETESPRSQPSHQLARTIDARLKPLASQMGLLYIAGDCILIMMAAVLLVAFWGGAYSEAWKLIALAGLCLYAADMLMIYHTRQGSYQLGALWEIFWILSALLFGLGASVEYGISVQMKQKRSRQHWI